MKRKLIFQKEIDTMLDTPDDLHEVINGRVVAKPEVTGSSDQKPTGLTIYDLAKLARP